MQRVQAKSCLHSLFNFFNVEKTKAEEALILIFKEGSILRDGKNFVGFLEHKYVFGYCYDNFLVVRSIDNEREWMLSLVKSCFANIDDNEKPDIREVWHDYYGIGVQITYGKLPVGWVKKP